MRCYPLPCVPSSVWSSSMPDLTAALRTEPTQPEQSAPNPQTSFFSRNNSMSRNGFFRGFSLKRFLSGKKRPIPAPPEEPPEVEEILPPRESFSWVSEERYSDPFSDRNGVTVLPSGLSARYTFSTHPPTSSPPRSFKSTLTPAGGAPSSYKYRPRRHSDVTIQSSDAPFDQEHLHRIRAPSRHDSHLAVSDYNSFAAPSLDRTSAFSKDPFRDKEAMIFETISQGSEWSAQDGDGDGDGDSDISYTVRPMEEHYHDIASVISYPVSQPSTGLARSQSVKEMRYRPVHDAPGAGYSTIIHVTYLTPPVSARSSLAPSSIDEWQPPRKPRTKPLPETPRSRLSTTTTNLAPNAAQRDSFQSHKTRNPPETPASRRSAAVPDTASYKTRRESFHSYKTIIPATSQMGSIPDEDEKSRRRPSAVSLAPKFSPGQLYDLPDIDEKLQEEDRDFAQARNILSDPVKTKRRISTARVSPGASARPSISISPAPPNHNSPRSSTSSSSKSRRGTSQKQRPLSTPHSGTHRVTVTMRPASTSSPSSTVKPPITIIPPRTAPSAKRSSVSSSTSTSSRDRRSHSRTTSTPSLSYHTAPLSPGGSIVETVTMRKAMNDLDGWRQEYLVSSPGGVGSSSAPLRIPAATPKSTSSPACQDLGLSSAQRVYYV